MKSNSEKIKLLTQEEMMEQMQKLFEERGSEALNVARKLMLEEKIECKEIRDALQYFMIEYWNDLVRPTLLSLACESVGGDPKLTNSVAVPMILISGAMDIHDDIIDGSKVKRKCPTIFGKFGKNVALLVGDALMLKGLVLLNQPLKAIPINKHEAVLEAIEEMFFQLGDAEALELQFRGRLDVPSEEYLKVLEKKAADVEAHTRIGAILGDGTREETETLGRYGRLLGMLIILRDDFRDSLDPFEMQHRLENEHLPLPVLYAITGESRVVIGSIIQKNTLTDKDARTVIEIAQKSGGVVQLRKLMKELARKASVSLETIEGDKGVLKFLVSSMLSPFLDQTPKTKKEVKLR